MIPPSTTSGGNFRSFVPLNSTVLNSTTTAAVCTAVYTPVLVLQVAKARARRSPDPIRTSSVGTSSLAWVRPSTHQCISENLGRSYTNLKNRMDIQLLN